MERVSVGRKGKRKPVAPVMYDASRIVPLIAKRHTRDVFVPECKTGPTWSGSPMRLDAWAMKRSWANSCFTGYEVKVARSDWLGDAKWEAYRRYCNLFYVVAPAGVVQLDELPAGVGLLRPSVNGCRLMTLRKAARTEIENPVDVLLYVLMSRATINDNVWNGPSIEYWREWHATKIEKRELGHVASRTIRELVATRIVAVESENRRLELENFKLQGVKDLLEKLDVSTSWNVEDRVREQIARLHADYPVDAINALHKARDAMTAVLENVPQTQGLAVAAACHPED